MSEDSKKDLLKKLNRLKYILDYKNRNYCKKFLEKLIEEIDLE